MTRLRIVLLTFMFMTSVLGAGEEGWTRFRGPDGSGQSDATGVPLTWNAGDYIWRVELPGIGHSSPVIWEDRVFVSSALPEDGTRIIRCLNTSDGELVWERRLPSSTTKIGNSTSFDTSSPVVDDARVYVAWLDHRGYIVAALDQKSGEEVWRRDLGPYESEHGFGTSPILFNDFVILANDQKGPSSVLALDCRTGETKWKLDRRSVKAAYSTPFFYRPDGEAPQLIVTSTAHGVSSIDPTSGGLNWEMSDVFGDLRVVGSPVAAGGLILAQCGVGGGGQKLVAIRPPGATHGEAEVAFEVKGSLPYVPTPVASDHWVFLISDNGVASCIDLRTGERVWRERIGGNFFGSPVRVGKAIYCISREGEMVVFAAAPQFEILGRIDLEEASHSTPAVSDGVMFIRTFSHLMAIGGGAE